MSTKRMYNLVLRYEVAPSFVFRIPSDDEYVSTPRPLKVGVCEESFWAGSHIPIHPFMEKLLNRYR